MYDKTGLGLYIVEVYGKDIFGDDIDYVVTIYAMLKEIFDFCETYDLYLGER